MGALLKVVDILPFDYFLETVREELSKKFPGRDKIVEGNIEAIRRAYQEVKVG